MSLRSLFDSIVAKSSEAKKCYDMGMFAESAQLCAMVQDDNHLCIQALRQAMDSHNSEVQDTYNPYLTGQSQVPSGESSMEGSMNFEHTPPQNFSGVSPASLKRKPSSGRHQGNKKSSRPPSPPSQRQLAPLKDGPSTPPSSYYQTDFTTPQQHHMQTTLARPTILASQSLPHDLNLMQSQSGPFMTPQIPQSPYAGYQNQYPVFRSQPGTPYFTPNTVRAQQMYNSPSMDFARQSQMHVAHPMNLIDPRSNPSLQFSRRPSEPTVPTHAHASHTPTAATPATPTINLPGHTMSFPSAPPANQSSGESPFPPNLLPQLDSLFVAFLQRVVQDETITDGRGEALHHPLPPRKLQKVHALPLTSWRPIKLRIQAFTSAFQEELAKTLAAGMNLARHEVSIKRVREYLWTRDLIARYNPSGRKAKSRGSHVWCVEARHLADDPNSEWEFRPWKRKIQVVRETLISAWGQPMRIPLKVWDPQVQYEDLEVKFSVRGQLPSWLRFESESVIAGTPPPANEDESYTVPIALSANYSAFGMSHVIESRLELDIRSPNSGVGDLASSLRGISNVQASSSGNPGVEGGMDSYIDDDDDDMMYLSGQNAFSSENNTPPSAITPSMTNPNQLLYVPSQSLQNSPMKQTSVGPTPPTSAAPLSAMSLNAPQPLTPTLSPASTQFNQHVVPSSRQPSSAPQTPHAGTPSQLSLQIPQHTHDMSSVPAPPSQGSHFRYTNDMQPSVMYGIQNQMRLSPPTSTESTGGRMYGIDEELGDNNSMGHGYFDEAYPLELGSPFLER